MTKITVPDEVFAVVDNKGNIKLIKLNIKDAKDAVKFLATDEHKYTIVPLKLVTIS